MPVTLDPRALLTLDEAKDWLNVATAVTANDDEIKTAINNVSQRIHQEAEREFKVSGTNPQTRVFAVTASGGVEPWYVDGVYMGSIGPTGRTVKVGDLSAFTAVQVLSSTDWTTVVSTPTVATQVRGLPLVREEWEPFTELEFRYDVTGFGVGALINVTGTWGFPAVPAEIKQAALDGVAWLLDRDVEHYRTDLGQVGGEREPVIMMMGGAQRVLSLPTVALAACWRYRSRQVG